MALQDSSLTDRALAEQPVGVALTRRRRLGMILKVIELRARFIVLMAATGLVFASWDTLVNHVEKWSRPRGEQHPSSSSQTEVESFCPMHPSVVSEQSGQCPICGMLLARRERIDSEILPSGVLSRVRLAPGQIAQAGIRTVALSFAPAIDRLTTIGLVGFDDSRRVQVVSEGRGRARIERLHVHSEGEHVRAGQRLAECYSYDVAQSIRVLLEASSSLHAPPATRADPDQTPLRRSRRAVPARDPDAPGTGSPPGSDRRDRRGRPSRGTLALLAPIGGLVIKKTAYQGQYVPEGTILFEIADLGHVWVDAQIFEDQLALVRVGQPVAATVPAFPGEEFRGHVEQLAPALDLATHTLAVRFGFDNPGDRLRPGMLATVALDVARRVTTLARGATCPVTRLRSGTMGRAISVDVQGRKVSVCCEACVPKLKAASEEYLALGSRDTATPDRVMSVPESAVVDTGTKTIVYVEASPGVFEGRAVVLGPRWGDSFPVLDGLAPGDRIAAAGAFLIDAETRLNPSLRSAGPSAAANDPR
jgi:membrane fusion protein, copper/silver efflux system